MDGRLIRTNCDEAGDYVVSNVLSRRDLVSRPGNMDETVLSSTDSIYHKWKSIGWSLNYFEEYISGSSITSIKRQHAYNYTCLLCKLDPVFSPHRN